MMAYNRKVFFSFETRVDIEFLANAFPFWLVTKISTKTEKRQSVYNSMQLTRDCSSTRSATARRQGGCCSVRCASLIVLRVGMPWPKTGAIHHRKQLNFQTKVVQSKGGLYAYAMVGILLNGLSIGCYQQSPEVFQNSKYLNVRRQLNFCFLRPVNLTPLTHLYERPFKYLSC